MMHIPPSEADRLSLWKYEALLFNWNEAHSRDDIEAPDPEVAMRVLELANADPRLTH